MSRIEEMTTVRANAAQAMRLLRDHRRMRQWMAPDLTFTPIAVSLPLAPGDRFRVSLFGGLGFEYLVEVISDRELVLAFWGPWSGRERWSFVPDGAETIVRRTYEVSERGAMPAIVWDTAGRALVGAHYKLELLRFRTLVERDPGPRAEIEAASSAESRIPNSESRAFPVDDG